MPTIKEKVTLWKDIKKKIEFSIIRGDTRPGDKIPPVARIAETFNCGESTIKKTLDIMCQEGTLYKIKGRGYFVESYIAVKLARKNTQILEENIIHIIKDARDLGIEMSLLSEKLLQQIRFIYQA